MPWLIPIAAGAASAIVSAASGAAGVGKVKDSDIPGPYKISDYGNFAFGGEGDRWQQMADKAGVNRDAGTIANQQALVSQLQQMAAGKGPSAAQGVLQQGKDEAIRTAMAMAGSARGSGLGAAQLGATDAAARETGKAANSASILRAQEQQAAIGQLGTVLGGMRQAYSQEEEQRQQLEEFYRRLGFDTDNAALQARMRMEELKANSYENWAGRKSGQAQHNASMDQKYAAGVGTALSSMGAGAGQMFQGYYGKGGGNAQGGGDK